MICDYHTQSMIDLADVLSQDTPYSILRDRIMDRLARYEAGAVAVPRSFLRRLKAIDANLSARWDMFRQCWVIERYVERLRANMEAFTANRLDNRVFDVLYDSDSRRFKSVQEFMSAKNAEADKRRSEIDRQNNEKLMGVFDSLSKTQIENFCEVNEYLANKGVVCG